MPCTPVSVSGCVCVCTHCPNSCMGAKWPQPSQDRIRRDGFRVLGRGSWRRRNVPPSSESGTHTHTHTLSTTTMKSVDMHLHIDHKQRECLPPGRETQISQRCEINQGRLPAGGGLDPSGLRNPLEKLGNKCLREASIVGSFV